MENYFYIYTNEWHEALNLLDDLQLGRLMRALIKFHKNGEVLRKDENNDIYTHFLFMSSKISIDINQYEERKENEKAKKEKFIEWGKRGGRPSKNKKESIKKDIVDDKKEKPKRKNRNFKIPTPQMIQEYCNERKNGISGEEFYDFYNSKGWKIGNSNMKDWKSAVRTWERNKLKNNQNQYLNKIKPISKTVLHQKDEYREF